MNDAALVSIALAVLPLARTHEELETWWKDNLPWIRTIRASSPAEYDRLVEAGKLHRARLGPDGRSFKTASSMRS